MESAIFFDVLRFELPGRLPQILASLVGVILGIAFMRRAAEPAACVLIASGVNLLVGLSQPLLLAISFSTGWATGEYLVGGRWFWIITAILSGVCWIVVVLAALLWRTKRIEAVSPPASPVAAHDPPTSPALAARGGPPVKPLSKGLYLGLIFGGVGLSWLLLIPGIVLVSTGRSDETAAGMVFVCAAYVPLIVMVVTLAILVHRMWSAIQGGPVRTTPGKAVGFLFIPFFNVYWVFQAYWGWAVDYNRTTAEWGIAAPRASEGLALTLCILTLCSLVPFVGVLVALVNIPLLFMFLSSAINGVNAIAAASGKGPAAVPA